MNHTSPAKKIIIVGASSGVGLALAGLYVAEGCRVAVTGRRCDRLETFRDQYPGCVSTACFDVTGDTNIRYMESMIKELGGLDLLVYAAGVGEVNESMDLAIDLATTLTSVNGFLEIANYSYNYFARQGGGHLVAISSVASLRGSSRAPAYSAGKAYMSRYLEGLSIQARKIKRMSRGKINITVTDIRPGFIKTKPVAIDHSFWEASPDKATRQIYHAISNRKRLVYITYRWAIIAWLLKWMPYSLYKLIG
jgi:short-subunit dehydrogenase